jgi:hypothetical protein
MKKLKAFAQWLRWHWRYKRYGFTRSDQVGFCPKCKRALIRLSERECDLQCAGKPRHCNYPLSIAEVMEKIMRPAVVEKRTARLGTRAGRHLFPEDA